MCGGLCQEAVWSRSSPEPGQGRRVSLRDGAGAMEPFLRHRALGQRDSCLRSSYPFRGGVDIPPLGVWMPHCAWLRVAHQSHEQGRPISPAQPPPSLDGAVPARRARGGGEGGRRGSPGEAPSWRSESLEAERKLTRGRASRAPPASGPCIPERPLCSPAGWSHPPTPGPTPTAPHGLLGDTPRAVGGNTRTHRSGGAAAGDVLASVLPSVRRSRRCLVHGAWRRPLSPPRPPPPCRHHTPNFKARELTVPNQDSGPRPT